MWASILSAFQSEFSDLPDTEGVMRIVIRLCIAGILGGALGYERETQGKSAGVRTHMLVAIGAAIFVLVPEQAGVKGEDLTRVIQGVIAGIGFLGAGSIIKGSAESDVKGLTTAASIWLTAAIGVACGLGRESTALLSAVLALVVLGLMPHVTRVKDK